MRSREIDRLIDALAARQHGIVTRAQLVDAGVPGDGVRWRVERGSLHRLHRGVYRVGPTEGRCTREMAAVLACAPGATLGHRSATAAWAMLHPAASAPVDVVTHAWRRPQHGIRIRRARSLLDDEVTVLDGVPITTPARTILDLASSGRAREVVRAVDEGIALRRFTLEELKTLVARHPRQPGAAALRTLIDHGASSWIRSPAEKRFRALLRRAGVLGQVQFNATVLGCEVDVWWPDHGLAIEVDGFAFHSSPKSFQDDRRRDAALIAAGLRVMRVTWQDITQQPDRLLLDIGRATAATPRG
jgi:very-short-patch-repair endonuclease/predicted transcriptional regulator of viral defense system